MIYIASLGVFLGVVFCLMAMLLLVEAKVIKKGNLAVVINEDEEKRLEAPNGVTLLSALVTHGILLPSACGGSGSCGMCKCMVEEGGRGILPTELPHLTRQERLKNVRLSCQLKLKEDLKIQIPAEIFNIKKYHTTAVSNDNVASFIKELVLTLEGEEKFTFTAGAYIQIDIPEYELAYQDIEVVETYRPVWDQFHLWGLHAASEEPVFRAYSMANTPAEQDFRFTVRIATPPPDAFGDIPPGVGSSYIFNLKPGDKVTLSGPYGDFFVKDSDREKCFIGGGAGMAPLRSQIVSQLRIAESNCKMTFWYGARSKKEMFYEAEFQELEKEFDNFSFFVALSDPEAENNWDGMKGFIHQCAHDRYLSTHSDPTEIEYYLCGPPGMLDATMEMLDSLGVEPEMIAYDKF